MVGWSVGWIFDLSQLSGCVGTGAAILDYTKPEGIHTHSCACTRASLPVYAGGVMVVI